MFLTYYTFNFIFCTSSFNSDHSCSNNTVFLFIIFFKELSNSVATLINCSSNEIAFKIFKSLTFPKISLSSSLIFSKYSYCVKKNAGVIAFGLFLIFLYVL